MSQIAETIVGLGVAGSLVCGAINYLKAPEPTIIERRISVPVESPEPKLAELLSTVPPAYGVPVLVAEAIAARESNGRMGAARFEPSQMKRARKVAPKGALEGEIQQYATSHCAMQVMGYHMPELGMEWHDLYDARVCVEVSMKILSKCMTRSKAKSSLGRLFDGLACYNGSEQYAREVIATIKDRITEQWLAQNL